MTPANRPLLYYMLSLVTIACLTTSTNLAQTRLFGSKPAPNVQKAKCTSGKKQIPLDIVTPNQPGQYPTVVFVHGLDGLEKTRKCYLNAAKRLAQKGYVVVIVDYFASTGTTSAKAEQLRKSYRQHLAG